MLIRKKDLYPSPSDGENLYLIVSPAQLGLDKDSNWKRNVSSVRVEVWKKKGKDDPTQLNMGNYRVIVFRNGTSSVVVIKENTDSFSFAASKQDSMYEIVLMINDKTADSKTVIIGRDGSTGAGISNTQWYYLATTMSIGVTRNTPGWTTDYQVGTQDLPYVWRYGDTLLTDGSHLYSPCEMVHVFSAGSNANLLEQTNFTSMMALGAWDKRNICYPVEGGTVTQETYASIVTGLQAHNAYYDQTTKTASEIQMKEVLQQCLWSADGTVRKVEPSTWYTLSFWAKGDNVTTYIYPNIFDNTVVSYVDGVMQAPNTIGGDACINWSLNGSWERHTFTFRTKGDFGSSSKYLLFRLFPKESAAISNTVYICMPKLEVGMQATGYVSNEESTHRGQLRRRRWAVNTEYLRGGVDELYEDVVLVESAGFYNCIKSHVSSASNRPGTGENWQQYWEVAQSGQYEMLSTDIFFAEKAFISNLISTLIQTGYSGEPHVEAEGAEFKLFGRGQYPAIFLTVNDNGQAVLRFQDENTGEFLYDLGPGGIMTEFTEVDDTYSMQKLCRINDLTRIAEILNIPQSAAVTYYRFNEGYKQIGEGSSATKRYNVSGTSVPSDKNAKVFKTRSYTGQLIDDGWYARYNNGQHMEMPLRIMQTNENDLQEPVGIYMEMLYHYSGGELTESVIVYFLRKDIQYGNRSVGCDKNGNELDRNDYPYIYSYGQSISMNNELQL